MFGSAGFIEKKMNFWDWFPIFLWPAALLYALLCALIVPRVVQNLNSVPTAILALPAIAIEKYLIDNSSQSLTLLFDTYFAFVVAGIFCCFAFFRVYFSKWTVASRMGVMILCALLGPALLFFGSNVLIQDYVLSRLVIEGTVSRLNVETSFSPEYQVTIETKRFWATPSVFDTLQVGDHIRAEVGKGSLYIFKIERIPGTG
jgi:hypothetical protein